MRDILQHYTNIIDEVEEHWSDTITKVQQEEEYNTSTIILYAQSGMERLVKQAFHITSSEIKKIFNTESSLNLFNRGAEYLKNDIANKFLKEGHSIPIEQIWLYYNDYKEKEFEKSHKYIFNSTPFEEFEPLAQYMYFFHGMKSFLTIFNEKFPQEKFFDLKGETTKTKMHITQLNQNINEMNESLHGKKNLINKFHSELDDVNLELSKVKNVVDQMTFEIKGNIHKKLLPSLGELEELLSNTNLRLGKMEEKTATIARHADTLEKNLIKNTEKLEHIAANEGAKIQNLEEKFNTHLKRIDTIAQQFLKKNKEFLIIKKDMLQKLDGTSGGMIDVMEYGLHNYSLEIALSSQRIPKLIDELLQKIESTRQYNSIIPLFWINILIYIYEMSHNIKKINGEIISFVNIKWYTGIEEMLKGLNQIFTDKDALKAMRSVSDMKLPVFKEEKKVWERYTSADEKTKKALYNTMKEYRNNPTYLSIGIPSILSTTILNIAIHHRDIPEFIWFCSVAYDEMWNHYNTLFQEMVKRRME